MTSNPVALILQPGRVLAFVLGLLASVTALSTLDLTVDTVSDEEAEVSRVELLR
jgi:hypothetical protein